MWKDEDHVWSTGNTIRPHSVHPRLSLLSLSHSILFSLSLFVLLLYSFFTVSKLLKLLNKLICGVKRREMRLFCPPRELKWCGNACTEREKERERRARFFLEGRKNLSGTSLHFFSHRETFCPFENKEFTDWPTGLLLFRLLSLFLLSLSSFPLSYFHLSRSTSRSLRKSWLSSLYFSFLTLSPLIPPGLLRIQTQQKHPRLIHEERKKECGKMSMMVGETIFAENGRERKVEGRWSTLNVVGRKRLWKKKKKLWKKKKKLCCSFGSSCDETGNGSRLKGIRWDVKKESWFCIPHFSFSIPSSLSYNHCMT